MKKRKTPKEAPATTIARLEQQARELRAGHEAHLRDLKATHREEVAEATRLHRAAVAHEKTLSGALKNVWAGVTGS